MLKNIKVFNELTDADYIDIEDYVQWKSYIKNDLVLAHNDPTNNVFIIAIGSVKATRFSYSGKEISYQSLNCGEIFGEIAAIDGGFRTTSIICAEDSHIGSITSDDFLTIIQKYPSVSLAVMKRMSELIRFLCSRVYEYSALDVKDRIRAEIVRHARNSADTGLRTTIKDLPTHEEIANKVSTHREAVTKEFSRLAKAGLIIKHGRELEIPDIGLLARSITEEI